MKKILVYWVRLISTMLILLLAAGTGSFSPVGAARPSQDIPTIDPVLLEESQRSETVDFLITFDDEADLSAANEMDWEARGWYVYETLADAAESSQGRVRAYLDRAGITYQPFWIQNVILVESSTTETMMGLLDFVEIDSLESNAQMMLVEPDEVSPVIEGYESRTATSNLLHINANDAWAAGFRGEGMVVGSIDTGVRYTHEALFEQYRGNLGGSLNHNFNWWDAVYGSNQPVDHYGHGTHVTGIMVGTDGSGNEIGVAPGAEWIACNAFDNKSASAANLLECAQFMLAPTNLSWGSPNPSMRPHVINNSWGDCAQTYNDWFENAIDAWLAAGIYPVFANGNASNCGYSQPPGLNTVGNPARSYHVTAVGSTGNSNGLYASHSNWGPTDSLDTLNANGYPTLKPQVVAPGVSILSSYADSDYGYVYASGTSMSAPHVSGMVALLWQMSPGLVGDYVATETLIQNTADPIPYPTGNGDEGPGNVPNHATGWGEIDVWAAYQALTVTFSDFYYFPLFSH